MCLCHHRRYSFRRLQNSAPYNRLICQTVQNEPFPWDAVMHIACICERLARLQIQFRISRSFPPRNPANLGSKIRFWINLVPRALFPGFGGGAVEWPLQSQEKAPWGRGCFWIRRKEHTHNFKLCQHYRETVCRSNTLLLWKQDDFPVQFLKFNINVFISTPEKLPTFIMRTVPREGFARRQWHTGRVDHDDVMAVLLFFIK